MKKFVVMIGPVIDGPGGMSSVVASYRRAGFFERWNVRYLATYRHATWGSKLWQLLKSSTAFLTLLLGRRVIMLHAHAASRGSFWRKCIFVGLARLWRIPVVLHIHSGEFDDFYHRECGAIRQAVVRWAMRTSALVVCLTRQWQATLTRIEPKARFEYLPNPVDVDVQGDLPSPAARTGPRTVLFLGRLRERKGVFDLVRSWPVVQAAAPGTRLLLAGDGDVQPLLALASELGVADTIDFPGWIAGDVKASWLNRSEVFVLPSYAEGLPVCILEAMAHGLTIVATSVGGIPEVVRDGQEAILVRPGDSDALARALVLALCDHTLARSLRGAARRRVIESFSTPLVLARLDELYRGQLGIRNRRELAS